MLRAAPASLLRRVHRILSLAIASACLDCATPSVAQTSQDPLEPPARPRICLVLEGGGALGLAHVGVLQVLEEMRVPVDCIVGTSMGAIIGGLYSAGYSAPDLATLVQDLDWPSMIRDRPDRRHLPFRRKVDDLEYLTRWELGISRKGIQTPPGLVAGHRLGTELRILALKVNGVTNFDDLPVPFRATATDIVSGELVVLDHGDFATALRASMAVPGLFSPVELDGRLLVDGGVAANLPVAQARAMGADIVIAVDLGQPLAEGARPESMVGIVGRTVSFVTRLGVERALPDVDLLIRPQVSTYGLLDFNARATIVERGRQAAAAQAGALSTLALAEPSWQAHLAERRRRELSGAPIHIASVAIESGRNLPLAAVEDSVRTRPGSALDPQVLRADLDRLWELGEFSAVEFALTPADAGSWALQITGKPPALGTNVARFGLSLASDLEGENSFNALSVVTLSRLNRLGGEVKVAVEAGESPRVSTELYQPVLPSRVPFIAIGLKGALAKYQLDVDSTSVQYRAYEGVASFDLGLSLGRFGELRGGFRRYARNDAATSSRPDGSPQFSRDDAGARLALVVDQLDAVNFPRHGTLLVSEYYRALPGLGADADYRRFDLGSLSALSRGRHTVVARLHLTSALGDSLPEEDRLELGGLFDLSGSPHGEIQGNYGGVATLIYLYRLGRLPNFGDGLYLGGSLETGNAWETSADVALADLRRSFAVVFGADTLLGPVYLGWGRTQGGKDSFYLYVGRTF